MIVRLRTNIAPTPKPIAMIKIVRQRKGADYTVKAETGVEHLEVKEGSCAELYHFSRQRRVNLQQRL